MITKRVITIRSIRKMTSGTRVDMRRNITMKVVTSMNTRREKKERKDMNSRRRVISRKDTQPRGNHEIHKLDEGKKKKRRNSTMKIMMKVSMRNTVISMRSGNIKKEVMSKVAIIHQDIIMRVTEMKK